MAYLRAYTNAAAAATYKKITAGSEELYLNKVYKSTTAKCLYYVNNKGFLHILQAGKTLYNGRVEGFHLVDSLLTNNNTLEYKKNYTRDFKTLEELQNFIIDLIGG